MDSSGFTPALLLASTVLEQVIGCAKNCVCFGCAPRLSLVSLVNRSEERRVITPISTKFNNVVCCLFDQKTSHELDQDYHGVVQYTGLNLPTV